MIFRLKFVNDVDEVDVDAPEKNIPELYRRLLRTGKFQVFKTHALPIINKPINDVIINVDNIKTIQLVGKSFSIKKRGKSFYVDIEPLDQVEGN